MKVNVKSLSTIAMAIFCFTEVHFAIAQDVGPYPIRSIHMIVPRSRDRFIDPNDCAKVVRTNGSTNRGGQSCGGLWYCGNHLGL